MNPMKKKILAAKGGRVIIECKPKAAPKPKFSWSKGTEWLVNSSRSGQTGAELRFPGSSDLTMLLCLVSFKSAEWLPHGVSKFNF